MTGPDDPIPGGCILLARKLLNSDLMDCSPLVVKLWIWLLLKANWKIREQLERGQLVTTIAEMQGAMSHYAGWRKVIPSKDEIRTAYEALTKATRITTRRTTRGMVITIVNYDTYQELSAYASHSVAHKETATKPTATPHDTEESKKQKHLPTESLRLSGLLADLILKNNPGNTQLRNGKREASVKRWAQDIDKLMRLDGQTVEKVEAVIRWCQGDSFWQGNILSGATLKKQWNKLVVRMNGSNEKNYSAAPTDDRSREDFKRMGILA